MRKGRCGNLFHNSLYLICICWEGANILLLCHIEQIFLCCLSLIYGLCERFEAGHSNQLFTHALSRSLFSCNFFNC